MSELLTGAEEEKFFMDLAHEDAEQNVIDVGSLVQVRHHPSLDPERVFVVSRFDEEGRCYLNVGSGELPDPFDESDLSLFTGTNPEGDEKIFVSDSLPSVKDIDPRKFGQA